MDWQPKLRGKENELQGLDGFLVVDPKDERVIYVVGDDAGRIGCLLSRDQGETWSDLARSDESFHAYSIGGARTVTEDGWIVGTFTDQQGDNTKTDPVSKVYFFRIRAGGR